MINKALSSKSIYSGVFAGALFALLACSTDSPTAPVQTPAPPGGGIASAAWHITVKADPDELVVGSADPTTVSVEVRRADNNQAPTNGTTIVLSTSLGDLASPLSGLQSVALTTIGGRAQTLLFPGQVVGTAFVNAQLEASVGQERVSIENPIEEVFASFASRNTNGNLSVQFQNTSTGDPTKFSWQFGDGTTSTLEHPSHLYREEGDYVVVLTASKKDSSDTVSQIVNVTEDADDVIAANFEATVEGRTVLFRDTSAGNPTSWRWDFGDSGTSSEKNPVHTYASEGNYVVTLTAKNSRTEDTVTQTISVSEPVFVAAVTPNAGPASGGTTVTISGSGFVSPLRVLFGGVLASTVSVSSDNSTIVVISPPGVIQTVACDDNGDDVIGTRSVATAVPVVVELGSGGTGSVSGGFTYLPGSTVCVGD